MSEPLRDLCKGRWREILPRLGIPSASLTGKHMACPACGGDDRWRFTDKNRVGMSICNQCGAMDGFSLLMKTTGWPFAKLADEVERMLGDLPAPQADRKKLSADELRRMRRELWKASVPISSHDPVDQYLRARGIEVTDDLVRTGRLRYVADCRYNGGERYPAMIALVSDEKGNPVQIHRTYLSRMKVGLAEVDNPRRMMPGSLPHGSAIRLFDIAGAGKSLIVAEGIETALSAGKILGGPVWSCVDAAHLMSWNPPPMVKDIVVAGDNDQSFTGQAAAYALAQRLTCRNKCRVEVRLPGAQGTDWNDVARQKRVDA